MMSKSKYKFPILDEEEVRFREKRTQEYEEKETFFLDAIKVSSRTGGDDYIPPKLLCFPYRLGAGEFAPITTADHLIALARQLLNWEGARDVFDRVGRHKDWEDEEQKDFIYEVLLYHSKHLRVAGQFFDNIEISIALARAMAACVVDELDDKAAAEFVKDRIRLFKREAVTEWKLPKLSELLQFFQNLKNNRQDLVHEFNEFVRLRDNGIKLTDRDSPSLLGFLVTERSKYGLANRNIQKMIFLEHAIAHCAWNRHPRSWDDEAVLAELRRIHDPKSRHSNNFIDDLKTNGDAD